MEHKNSLIGTLIGGSIGLIKGVLMIVHIDWSTIGNTAILAAVGACTGFLVTETLKYIKNKINNNK